LTASSEGFFRARSDHGQGPPTAAHPRVRGAAIALSLRVTASAARRAEVVAVPRDHAKGSDRLAGSRASVRGSGLAWLASSVRSLRSLSSRRLTRQGQPPATRPTLGAGPARPRSGIRAAASAGTAHDRAPQRIGQPYRLRRLHAPRRGLQALDRRRATRDRLRQPRRPGSLPFLLVRAHIVAVEHLTRSAERRRSSRRLRLLQALVSLGFPQRRREASAESSEPRAVRRPQRQGRRLAGGLVCRCNTAKPARANPARDIRPTSRSIRAGWITGTKRLRPSLISMWPVALAEPAAPPP
jgi:hypothetical protein